MTNNNLGEVEVTYKYKSTLNDRPLIKSSFEAFEIINKLYKEDTMGLQEQFVILYLNRSNKLIGCYNGFKGSTSSTIVDMKIVLSTGLKLLATNLVVAHNHPSGNLTPSNEDIALTEKLKKGLELIDMKLLDHLILSPDGRYLSFADEQLLT